MNSVSLIVFSLAVLGASALSCGCYSSRLGVATALPGPTFVSQAPVESTVRSIPSYIPPVSVSQSCHGMKTVVRPQIRNEIITAPSVDSIVRYAPCPYYETFSVSTPVNVRSVDIPTVGVSSGISESVVGGVSSGIVSGVSSGIVSGGLSGSLVSVPVSVSGVGSYGVSSGIVGNVGCGSNIVV